MAEFDLFGIMRTTRSMRRLKTDPVPDTLLSRILECGTYAASGGNMQAWRFLVIRDRKTKEAAGAWYRKVARCCGTTISIRRTGTGRDAWDSYQKGLWHLLGQKLEDIPRAREYFARALKLDPTLASAHTSLAWLHI